MNYQLYPDRDRLSGSLRLPASKSVSNRLLILNALATSEGKLENLSDSDDTRVLQQALTAGDEAIDIGHAGTAMRFLTAYLSIREGNFFLTGSERMKRRPIGKLVDALVGLGADIRYGGEQGYPPLHIRGRKIRGGRISIDSSISSQYISALMMIGPSLQEGLTLQLENEVISSSYIRLTAALMKDLGIPVVHSGQLIEIPFHPYAGKDMKVEGDWSAASYWYAMAALSGGTELGIVGLTQESLQGDSVLPELFHPLGVQTSFSGQEVGLKTIRRTVDRFEFDFRDNPDLVQTLAVLCGVLRIPFMMKGTKTLRIKETDRILALKNELAKLGVILKADPNGEWISWNGGPSSLPSGQIKIGTYQDHRMAMAFSPAALKFPGLIIEDPEVVHKSYPGFWKDLERTGFRIVPA
jgi:3-phosphoshikimate 1-carboxyvinyltransferase